MEKFYLISLILCLFLSGPSCKKSQEAAKTEAGKKVEKASQTPTMEKDEESTLKIVASSGNTVGVDLTNRVPVKGVQFIIEGVKVTEVRTTSRTEGFFAKVNEKNGTVVMVSMSGNKIAPGAGPIAEIVCDNGSSPTLSDVKIQ